MKRVPEAGFVGAAALREAAAGEFRQITELVRAALVEKLALPKDQGWMLCVEAMFADRVIVRRDGRFWSYGYKLSDDNTVELADAKEVVEEFVPVKLRESLEHTVFVEAREADGSAWDAVLVRSGASKNRNYYPDAVLRESVSLFEGARVYAKSNDEHLKGSTPDVHKLAGWISGARFVEGSKPDTGYVAGRVNLTVGELRDKITDAWQRGKRDLVGLSIDVLGKAERRLVEGVKRAAAITKVNSVDLIIDPSAGGALVRLVEAVNPEEQSEMNLKEKMQARVKARFPNVDVATLTDEQLEQRYAEACAPEAPASNAPAGVVTKEELEQSLRMVEARAAARVKIAGSGLPKPAQDKLQARFDGLARFVEADVDNEIKAEREYLARFTESGRVQLGGLENVSVEDRAKKIADMLDAFFDPKHKDHAKVQSFRECYIEMTGDRRVTGRLEHMDRTRLAESLGVAFRESLDTTALGDVLGSAMHRRLLADYRENTAWDAWRLVCNVVPVNDFRTNERTRFGGYGDLPDVNQGAAYQALTSPADEKASYAVTKRGGTEDLTLEAIKNDDVGVIRRIPIALARAAKRTLCKFVFDFVKDNPTLYDTVAFFHASHGNLGSAALDATSLAARRLAMKKQTEAGSAARIGVGPRFLVVPDDLEETAVNLFNRNTNNDKTFVQTLTLTVVPVPYWTDTNDWALAADPMDIPGIEIGFLDGQQEPEIFVQDQQNVGSMFSNDKLTYKIRHVYGGDVVEYRGWDKSVVA